MSDGPTLLHCAGVASLVLERRARAHVESRIRAGVLEQGTAALLECAGVADRLHREGLPHGGFSLALDGEAFRIDLRALTGGKGVAHTATAACGNGRWDPAEQAPSKSRWMMGGSP